MARCVCGSHDLEARQNSVVRTAPCGRPKASTQVTRKDGNRRLGRCDQFWKTSRRGVHAILLITPCAAPPRNILVARGQGKHLISLNVATSNSKTQYLHASSSKFYSLGSYLLFGGKEILTACI